MKLALKDNRQKWPAAPWGTLPPHMKVLYVTGAGRTGNWLAEAFASDSACHVEMHEAIGVAQALARLREEVFDAVLIGHEGEQLDALDLAEAIRSGMGQQVPLIVLGQQSEQELSPLCYEVGADAYVCVNTTTTRTLLWEVARAMERHRLIIENRRLEQAHRHRLQLEHDEATRLLDQQRQLILGLEQIRGGSEDVESSDEQLDIASLRLPDTLVDHYRQLLRAYVVMGSGSLTEEMRQLADRMAATGVTATQALLLHLYVLEEMIRSLGNRSARHVMNRADLLILEITLNLTEGYRHRLLEQLHPPRQLLLPGFEPSCANRAA